VDPAIQNHVLKEFQDFDRGKCRGMLLNDWKKIYGHLYVMKD